MIFSKNLCRLLCSLAARAAHDRFGDNLMLRWTSGISKANSATDPPLTLIPNA